MSKKQCRACVFMPYPLDHPCHTLIAPVLSLDLHHLELKSAYIIYRLSDSSLITPASIQCIMKTPFQLSLLDINGHELKTLLIYRSFLTNFPWWHVILVGSRVQRKSLLAADRSRQQYRCAYGKVIWGCQLGTGKYSEKYLSQLV